MGKRRSDADSRRFFDEFEKVRVSRFRASGVIDPAKRQALIPFPNGKVKLLGTAHTHLKYGGGYSYFVCPKCGRLAQVLYLIEDAPRCIRCCEHQHGGQRIRLRRDARRRASDKHLDQLVAKLESRAARLKPAPSSWAGKAQIVYNGRGLTERMRRGMISLRLDRLASQQAKDSERKTSREPTGRARGPGRNPRAETSLARKHQRNPAAGAR